MIASGRSGRHDEGSLTIYVTLLAVALLALIGLVVDGGTALAATRTATDVADQAARAGAGAVDPGDLHDGQVRLNPPAAIAAARSYLASAGMPGRVTVQANEVTVSISFEEPTTFLGIIGIDHIDVHATARAIDVHGVVTSD